MRECDGLQSCHARPLTWSAAVLLVFTAVRAAAIEPQQVVDSICVACHNEYTLQAGLNLQGFDVHNPHASPVIAEKMIRKLNAGQMPPRDMPRNPEDIAALARMLETGLDAAARAEPRVGTRPFQRVNRAEYARLVHELLGLDIDPAQWLPEDQISASFD
ncbi:MAG TPA: DUF1587 domain-containing protein, partial [Woeseiaceae bacterium]|nr:DUF1587 domain-containing protein [Woeseiaceae bacterium]